MLECYRFSCKFEEEDISLSYLNNPILEMSFPCISAGKETACNVGDLDSIPGLGRSPGEGKGYPLQYFAWKIPWTEEPGHGQRSPNGHKRVGHDLAAK